MKKEDCFFCKLAAGEFPSNTIYEDDDFRVILDIAPAAKGHAIAICKNHMPDLLSIEPDTAAKALPVLSTVARAMKKALGCDGINILQNNGEAAGQTVFHLHFHIIPRYTGDGLTIPGKSASYAEGEAEEIAAKIRAAIKEV